jgi:Invasion associated locus B (IalB) protein
MRKSHNKRFGTAITTLGLLVLAATASAQTVDLVGEQSGWSLYADKATPKAVCFLAAQPQSMDPPTAKRGPIFFYISAWPKDGIKTEPSVKAGYPIAPDKEMSVTIGPDTFKLFAKADRGFVSNPTEELKLIEAMKKGSTAVVKATSARGTSTSDTYALGDFAPALQKLAETCP